MWALQPSFKVIKTEKVKKVFESLMRAYPYWNVPLKALKREKAREPFKILISGILSTRTKDGTTAHAVKRFFEKIKKPEDIGKFSEKEIRKLIYPVGFYKVKAKNIKKLYRNLLKYQGRVPDDIDELLSLPGVGSKVANLVLNEAFNRDAICVDTHVHRIVNRLGWVKTKNPRETEMKLKKNLPKRYWKKINYLLVALGQAICTPKNPGCSQCPIEISCPKVGIKYP